MNKRELLVSRLRGLEHEYTKIEALPYYGGQQVKLDYICKQYEKWEAELDKELEDES
jgi:hypothetical protein